MKAQNRDVQLSESNIDGSEAEQPNEQTFDKTGTQALSQNQTLYTENQTSTYLNPLYDEDYTDILSLSQNVARISLWVELLDSGSTNMNWKKDAWNTVAKPHNSVPKAAQLCREVKDLQHKINFLLKT